MEKYRPKGLRFSSNRFIGRPAIGDIQTAQDFRLLAETQAVDDLGKLADHIDATTDKIESRITEE